MARLNTKLQPPTHPSITANYVIALNCLLQTCIATPHKDEADPEEMKTIAIIRAYTRHAFVTFGEALRVKKWAEYEGFAYAVYLLILRLRQHENGYGVMSEELVRGLKQALDAHRKGELPFPLDLFSSPDNERWIEGLQCERWNLEEVRVYPSGHLRSV